MTLARLARAALLALACGLLAACASAPRDTNPALATAPSWSGRLALQVDDPQVQSFSALFELRGGPAQGELDLSSPLGATLARLSWAPGAARLQSQGDTRDYDSLDALTAQATGTPLPVAALFDWLAGVNTPVPGWEADLSQIDKGRLRASRLAPAPTADLRVAFDR